MDNYVLWNPGLCTEGGTGHQGEMVGSSARAPLGKGCPEGLPRLSQTSVARGAQRPSPKENSHFPGRRKHFQR